MTERRLLIIDDEANFGATVRRVAAKLDFAIEVTTQASEFKELYKRFDPTMIVADIVMPQADGIELVQWLAAMKYSRHVILVTGYDPSYARYAETLGRARGLFSIQILRKPISLAELRAALTATDAAA